MKGPAVTLTNGHYEFRIPPEGGSFSPIRLRPGGVANAVGGAFREFSRSGSAERMARRNRPSPPDSRSRRSVWSDHRFGRKAAALTLSSGSARLGPTRAPGREPPVNNRLESGGRNEHWDHTCKHRT
jgi:hypothetical protein